jgi:putative peptidoglycan lipid II flippase
MLLMGPRLISVATLQVNAVVTGIIANGFGTGPISAMTYAFPIMTVPLVVIGSGIGIATLPTFSAQFARGEMSGLRNSLTAALRGVLLLAIPATLGLILLSQPLVAFLFQRGNFTALSTTMTAWALLWFTVGLVFHCVLEILVRGFFALHETKTPALVSAGAMALNIGFCFAFPALFSRIGWMAFGGLALAMSVSTGIETTTLFLLLRKRLHGIQARELARGTGAAVIGTLGMSAGIVFWLQASRHYSTALITLSGVAIGGIIYGVVLLLLRVPELKSLGRYAQRFIHR